MNEQEAMGILKKLIPCIQKDRSNLLEIWGNEKAAALLNPLLFGAEGNDVLSVVANAVDRGSIDPVSFYNLMWVVDRNPGIGVVAIGRGIDVPKPNLDWINSDW